MNDDTRDALVLFGVILLIFLILWIWDPDAWLVSMKGSWQWQW